MKSAAGQTLVAVLWRALGRRNLVRLARLLSNAARLDIANDLASNGEGLVQSVLLRHAPGRGRVVVLDVGANVGRWSQALLERAAQAGEAVQVYAFEPCQATFQELERLAARWPNMLTPVALAVSNQPGQATLQVVADGAGTSSFYHHQPPARPTRAEIVAVTTVDAFCHEHGLTQVALLKCDAEGHDLFVVEGAAEMLARQAIDLIQFEYNHRWIAARRYLRDAFECLAPLGYRLGKVTPQGIEFYRQWHPELESYREGNYLACRAEWQAHFPVIAWWNDDQADGG